MKIILVVSDAYGNPVHWFSTEAKLLKWAKKIAKNIGLPYVDYRPWESELHIHNSGYSSAYTYTVTAMRGE